VLEIIGQNKPEYIVIGLDGDLSRPKQIFSWPVLLTGIFLATNIAADLMVLSRMDTCSQMERKDTQDRQPPGRFDLIT